MGQKVLVVDDDPGFRKTIRSILAENGFDPAEAKGGEEGLESARRDPPHLVVLDLYMPRLKGTEVCLRLKEDPKTAGIPVLILTGNDKEGQEVACLDMGADDYLTKPVRTERLLAHCRALLRRAAGPAEVSVGELRLDHERKIARLGRREYGHLTPKEFELLFALARYSPRPRQRAELYREVWGADPPSEISLRTVEVHVRRIRLKLGWRSGQWLQAITGRGYCLAAEPVE